MNIHFKRIAFLSIFFAATGATSSFGFSLSDLLQGAATNSKSVYKQPNNFGATVRNPGSVMPEWWNEEDYVPETLNGYQRLRIGSAGFNGRFAVSGRDNCDLVLLYYAKSGQQMPQAEMEECSLLEYGINKGVTDESVNLADVFAKQETIAKYTKILLNRIEKFKSTELFYSRAVGLRIQPYNLTLNNFEITANLTGNSTKLFSYNITGRQFQKSNSWYETRLGGFTPEGARSLESARSSYRIQDGGNVFFYKILGVKQESQRQRLINVEVLEAQFDYLNEQGTSVTISY